MRSIQRKSLVVEPAIQYSLVRQLLGQWALHLVATLILLTILQVFLGGPFRTLEYHLNQFLPVAAAIIVSMLCMLPVFVRSSLKLSNRFVGPIHRFRSEMKRIATDKEYQPISFRKDDFWSDLADDIDKAINALQRPANATDIDPEPAEACATGVGFSSEVTSEASQLSD